MPGDTADWTKNPTTLFMGTVDAGPNTTEFRDFVLDGGITGLFIDEVKAGNLVSVTATDMDNLRNLPLQSTVDASMFYVLAVSGSIGTVRITVTAGIGGTSVSVAVYETFVPLFLKRLALDTDASHVKATASGAVSAGTLPGAAPIDHIHTGLRAAPFVAGPWNNAVAANFTKIRSDTSLIVKYSASGIKLNAAGVLVVDGQLDGGKVANCAVYSVNFGPNEHRTAPTAIITAAGLAAGSHNVGFNKTDANTGSDANDRGSIEVWEVQP